MKILISVGLFFLIFLQVVSSSTSRVVYPIADASIRRDKKDKNYGKQSNITITKLSGSNARVALMRFDTSEIQSNDNLSTKLMLHIAGAYVLVKEKGFIDYDVSFL